MTNSNNGFEHNNGEISQLISKLKDKDLNYSTITKRGQYIYGILIIVYIVVFTIDLINEFEISVLISGLCFIVSFTIFFLILRKYSKEYSSVDYSEPTLQMLKKAAYRYKPFQKITVWLFLAILIMGVGIYHNTSIIEANTDMIFYFIFPILVGLIIGLVVWFFKYKPLRDEALALIKEIEK